MQEMLDGPRSASLGLVDRHEQQVDDRKASPKESSAPVPPKSRQAPNKSLPVRRISVDWSWLITYRTLLIILGTLSATHLRERSTAPVRSLQGPHPRSLHRFAGDLPAG